MLATEWSFGSVLWAMFAFFFWFAFIWIFIAAFSDILRRNDLSGGAKAGWIFLVIVLPLLGVLIYMIARPKVTAQDVELMAQSQAAHQAAARVSPADQIAVAADLKAKGVISDAEFEAIKQKALA
jgi:hypothetical protein